MNLFKKIVIFCLPCFLIACSTVPLPRTKTAQPESLPPIVVEPKAPIKVTDVDDVAKAPAAVTSLLGRAQQQEQNGDQQAAVGSLERAIRIAPRYPESYFRLGELRYKQSRYTEARSLAQKALSLGAVGALRNLALSLVERASSAQ